MVDSFNHCSFGHLRSFVKGVWSFCKGVMNSKSWVFQSFNGVIAVGSLLSFLLAIAYAYLFLFPIFQPAIDNSHEIPHSNNSISECNYFEGNWIQDENYPLYDASHCPFAERGFNCLANGRRDRGYTKWRWKPKNCEIPRFNAREILEKMRGKRVVFVGDSLGRTQWESLICMLMTGVEDKRSVYEVNGNKITKQIRFLGVRFSLFDLRIDFYRSVFLVQPGPVPRRAPKRVKSTLKIDKLDDISNEWIDSDVLIFNSGHWWTPSKLFEMGCYFTAGGSLKLGMPIVFINTDRIDHLLSDGPITGAFKKAMHTWASWANTTINANRTSMFIRTFESSHWSGRNRLSCKVTRRPSSRTGGRDRSRISDIIIQAVKKMAVPVKVLHVTPMGAFRSDAHVGPWSDNPSVPDCSHWCLPGVPDMWNEILLSNLLSKN